MTVIDTNGNMKIFYRISDGSYKKERFAHATKKGCLDNFLKHFPKEEVIIYADNVKDETYTWLETYDCDLRRTQGGSSAAGFRIVFQDALALDNLDEIVYFVEDDYLHLDGSYNAIVEGLQRADYVTLYLHGDRFIPARMGGNPYVDDSGAFVTRLLKTNSHFWCQVESTTMTFASTVGVLKEDYNIWNKHTIGKHPNDFGAFQELSTHRTLISPVPGLSTHCEIAWCSPLIDWNNIK